MSAKMAQSGDGVECSLACHEGHDRGLDASAQADDRQGLGGLHQPSPRWGSPPRKSPRPRQGACPSVAYLTSRVKRRRSRSWASGPGLKSMLTTPSSGPPLLEPFGLSWLLVSSISVFPSDADADHVGRLHRACAASVGVSGSHWPFVHLCGRTPVLLQCGRPESWA